MQPKPITPDLSVVAQIQPQDVAALAAAGFKSIICNRPDGEGPDQPAFATVAAAAGAAGLASAYLPIVTANLGPADALAFGALLDRLPQPVLAYCRSGTRSATLWALSQAGRGVPRAQIIAATQAAGYDVTDALRRLSPDNAPA